MTYREIAAQLGCSWQYVQKIEREALAKLRRRCRAIGLTPADIIDAPECALASVQETEPPPDRRAYYREYNRRRRSGKR